MNVQALENGNQNDDLQIEEYCLGMFGSHMQQYV